MRKIYVIKDYAFLASTYQMLKSDYDAYVKLKSRGAPVTYHNGIVCNSDEWELYCYKAADADATHYVFNYKGGPHGPNQRLRYR